MLESFMAWFLDWWGADEFLDGEAVGKLVMRLTLDLTAVIVVIRYIYVRLYRWNDYVFTYYAFNIITFATCFLLRKVPIELGFALGLFAVFGILRYRTEPIRIRDLTYLFVVIGLAILNSVANSEISVMELVLMNAIVVVMTYLLEYRKSGEHLRGRTITYDHLELLLPGREESLAADIKARTGLEIVRAEINSVDLLRDTAKITVYCPTTSGVLEA